MLDWILRRLDDRGSLVVLGIQGPQGCGKTTVCAGLVDALRQRNIRAASMSMDDVYLPHDRLRGRTRGPPGSHDMALLRSILRSVRGGRGHLTIPQYDKTAHGGRGDRSRDVNIVELPLQVFLLEGWCVGFTGEHFGEYERDIYPHLDGIIWLDAPYRCAYEWREDAERVRREAGQGAMTPEEVRAFVDEYMIYYETSGHWQGCASLVAEAPKLASLRHREPQPP